MEKMTIPFRCANNGKYFFITYVKKGGTYRINSIERDDSSQSDAVLEADPPKLDKIPISQFSRKGWFCPWCGDDNYFRCGSCGHYVCQHKTIGKMAQCYEECGSKGLLKGVIQDLTGQKESQLSIQKPVNNPKLSGPHKTIRKK